MQLHAPRLFSLNYRALNWCSFPEPKGFSRVTGCFDIPVKVRLENEWIKYHTKDTDTLPKGENPFIPPSKVYT